MAQNKHNTAAHRVAGANVGARLPFENLLLHGFCLMGLFLLMFVSSGCATAHATLAFAAPSTVTSGASFTVTVNVQYQGSPDTVVNSRIHFTSSDPSAVLPGDYYFTPADAGSHTWSNGFVLITPGSQTISGEIIQATGINGSAAITVSP